MSERHRKTGQGLSGNDMEEIEMSNSPGQSRQKAHKKSGFHLPHYEHVGLHPSPDTSAISANYLAEWIQSCELYYPLQLLAVEG